MMRSKLDLSIFLKDPFRFFFPLGWLAGLLGVGLWLPMIWGDLSSYPLQAHRLTMIGGFLLAFVTGFLVTAIPRFTSTWYLRGWEFLLLCLSILLAIYYALSTNFIGHYLSVFLTITILKLFAVQRFRKRNENPPFTSIFVAGGLFLWWGSSLVLVSSHFHSPATVLFPQASAIYNHGALLCLVIGVGGRLVPGLLGWKEIVLEQRSRYENTESFKDAVPLLMWLALALFLLSYFLVGLVNSRFIWLMRAVVMFYVALTYWRLYNRPKERTGFTWGVWVSGWSFVFGLLVPVFWPSSGAHGFHTIFIGGFSLLTILIATRVTLAHGTSGKELESSSRILKILVVLFVIAMLTRVTAAIWPSAYFSHLGYASLLWIVGIALWALVFIPRMLGDFEIRKQEG